MWSAYRALNAGQVGQRFLSDAAFRAQRTHRRAEGLGQFGVEAGDLLQCILGGGGHFRSGVDGQGCDGGRHGSSVGATRGHLLSTRESLGGHIL